MEQNKKSQLCWDMRITRTILKRNPTAPVKFCRYCGKLLGECDCPQPCEIIDVKKLRDSVDGSVAVFANTPEFQKVYAEVSAEIKAKDEAKKHPNSECEQLIIEGWE